MLLFYEVSFSGIILGYWVLGFCGSGVLGYYPNSFIDYEKKVYIMSDRQVCIDESTYN